jgi:serine/threonine-protein kinase
LPSSANRTAHVARPSSTDVYDQLLLGRYRVLEELGHGGFGTVSVCWDPRLMRRVAIKAIPLQPPEPQPPRKRGRRAPTEAEEQALADAGRRQMLLRAALAETRTASMLSHPNIVSMIDFEYDDEHAYIIMEYVEGASLAQLLDATDDGLLTSDEAAAVVEAVCEALQFAHENGVLHLDIKPDNILVERSGRVRLADFGMAALSSATGYAGARGGTTGYMPPEQVRCEDVDVRTDVFAFGSVMYEALTGARPFAAATPAESCALVERGAPDPCALNDDVDPLLADALLCAVDPDPDRRPTSAEELEGELLACLGRPKLGRKSLAAFVADVLDDSQAPEDPDAAETPVEQAVPSYREAGPLAVSLPRLAPALLRVAGAAGPAALAAASLAGALGSNGIPAAALSCAVVAVLGFAVPTLAGILGLAALAAACLAAHAWLPAAAVLACGAAWWYLVERRTPLACAPTLLTVIPQAASPLGSLLAGLFLPAGPAAASALVAAVAAWGASCAAGVGFSAANWVEAAGWVAAAAVMGALCHRGSKLRCYGACSLACIVLCLFQLAAVRMENGGSWTVPGAEVLLAAVGSSILVGICIFAFGTPRSLAVDGEDASEQAEPNEGGARS